MRKKLLVSLLCTYLLLTGCSISSDPSSNPASDGNKITSDSEYILEGLQTLILSTKVISAYSANSQDPDNDLTYTYSAVSGTSTVSYAGTFYNSADQKIQKSNVISSLPVTGKGFLAIVDNSNTSNYMNLNFEETLSYDGSKYIDIFSFTGTGQYSDRENLTGSISTKSETTSLYSLTTDITDLDFNISTADSLNTSLEDLTFTYDGSYTPSTFTGVVKNGTTTISTYTYNMNDDSITYTDSTGTKTIEGL